MEIWMGQESLNKEERLFLYLVSTFKTSALIALGEVENPVTKKIDVNLDQASYYINLLSMLQSKARGNMTEYEEQMLINTVSELEMKFIQEKSPKDYKHEIDENIANGTLEEE